MTWLSLHMSRQSAATAEPLWPCWLVSGAENPGSNPSSSSVGKLGTPTKPPVLDASYRNRTISGSAGVAAPALSIILNSLPSLRSTIRR